MGPKLFDSSLTGRLEVAVRIPKLVQSLPSSASSSSGRFISHKHCFRIRIVLDLKGLNRWKAPGGGVSPKFLPRKVLLKVLQERE